MLCHLKQEDIVDTAVGLKIAIERLGIDDVCHIWIDTEANYKVRLFFEPLGTYDGNYFFYGSEDNSEDDENESATIPVSILKRLYEESVQYNWLSKTIKTANEEETPCLVSDYKKMEKFKDAIPSEKSLHLSILTDIATEAFRELKEYGFGGT